MEISEALEFAAARKNGVLVTQKRDGRPQLSNITYADRRWCHQDLDHGGAGQVRQPPSRSPGVAVRDPRGLLGVRRARGRRRAVGRSRPSPTIRASTSWSTYYRSVAGEHPDWDDYRRAMVADKRVIVRLQADARVRHARAGERRSVAGSECDRHVCRPEDPDALWLPRDVAVDRQLGHPLGEQRQGFLQLGSGQCCAQAVMNAGAERHLWLTRRG